VDDPRDAAASLSAGAALTLCLLAAAAWPAEAARRTPPAPQARPPMLVVAITVDQLRGDYIERYGDQFTGGLARLIHGGAVFTDAYQDHALTETAPGHATVLSGRNPYSTGIVRNSEGVNDTVPLLEVPGPGASPRRFRGTALYDWMQRRWPGVRGLSVSRKDRGAILPMGRARTNVFWYEGGQFTTSRYYADSLPGWVRAFNRGAAGVAAPGRVWDLLLPPSAYLEPDTAWYESAGRNNVFPHVLPDDSARARAAFAYTPAMDSLTLAFALAGARHLRLGRGRQPDLLAISLSATDYIGHTYGPRSREIHDQVLRLDRALGWFLDSLLAGRDRRRVVVVLTADHGVTEYPEWSQTHGRPDAHYVLVDSLVRAWRDTLNAQLGPGAWIPVHDVGIIVLDRPGLTARGLDPDSIAGRLRADLLRLPGVQEVDTRASLAAADTATNRFARRWRNLLPPDARGDLFITLEDGMAYGAPWGGAGHGQDTDRDAHVTLVFWGDGVRPGRYTDRVSVTDIAPTLAHVLGVQPLERVDGRVLTEALVR